MPPDHRLDRNAPEEVRRQPAVQLRVERAHVAAIPTESLYRLREQLNADELTGVLTRRAAMAAVQEAIVRTRLSGNRALAAAQCARHTLQGSGWCSFSAGFADLREGDDAATLIGRAEECLYAGRRRAQRRDRRTTR